MGIGFNWFKNYKIVEHETISPWGGGENKEYTLEFIDSNSTDFGYGNASRLNMILKQYGDIEIPHIDDIGYYYKEDIEELANLINPKAVSKVCAKFLNDINEEDEEDLRDRIEWIKEISDEGYFISYDRY